MDILYNNHLKGDFRFYWLHQKRPDFLLHDWN